jgi:hypothetical protein
MDCKEIPVSEAQKIELDKRLNRINAEGSDDLDARKFLSELKSNL